jgi:hypothetical protein
MSEEKKEVAVKSPDDLAFESIQRKARLYTSSQLVPTIYQGNTPGALANTVIALNIAHRIGADELMVMQNLYVIQGRPSWSSQFIISALNSCGRFSPIRFELRSLGNITHSGKTLENRECKAIATELASGQLLEGPPVTIAMAIAEGWYGKNGSKWQTMPELMLRYRAASFFGRLYAPEILNGMYSQEEAEELPSLRQAGSTQVPEDLVKPASETQPEEDGDDFMLTGDPEPVTADDLWAKLVDLMKEPSLPASAKKEIQEANANEEKDVEKLAALLAKATAAIL